MPTILVVVPGFGCHLDSKLTNYLIASSCDIVCMAQDYPEYDILVLTSGGFTQKRSAPGVSEAGLMTYYLKNMWILLSDTNSNFSSHIKIITNENALTSQQNIEGIHIALEKEGLELSDIDQIYIMSEWSRKFKLRLFAWFELRKNYSITVNTFQNVKADILQIFIITPLDIAIFLCKKIGIRWPEKIQLALKRRQIENG